MKKEIGVWRQKQLSNNQNQNDEARERSDPQADSLKMGQCESTDDGLITGRHEG